jgi:protein-S-isoprenylcysteine O-methyltransferase Ste14
VPSWSRIARRIRVPLGFVFAAFYVWLARPSWASIVAGGAIAFIGVAIRAIASGYVKKNQELATSGPYAYSRNPLYVGSMAIGAGFAIAALNQWIALGAVALFVAIYIPVIRGEEVFLRATFPGFEDYCRRVPRFFGIIRRQPRNEAGEVVGGFSRELYLQHREYNAALGTLAVLAILACKLLWIMR